MYSTGIIHDHAARIVDDTPDHFNLDDWRSRKAIDEGSINFNYKDHEMYIGTCYAPNGPTAMIVKGLHPC
jgi:hypothetical protein